MSQAARKIQVAAPAPTPVVEPAAPRVSPARAATAADAAHASPALLLQEHLESQVGVAARPRWSHRRTIAFLALVNGAFWLTAGLLVARIF